MNILFLCVANSARSQMAEGLAKEILGPSFNIESAGSVPSGKVHPGAIHAMKKRGFNIEGHSSKSVDDLPKEFLDNLNYVITLCAEEACPVYISPAEKLKWTFPDPAGVEESLIESRFDEVLEGIESKLKEFKNTFN